MWDVKQKERQDVMSQSTPSKQVTEDLQAFNEGAENLCLLLPIP